MPKKNVEIEPSIWTGAGIRAWADDLSKIGDDLITVREAAQQLGVIPQRVRALLAADRIPGAAKRGGPWLIPLASIAAVQVRLPGNHTGRPRLKK